MTFLHKKARRAAVAIGAAAAVAGGIGMAATSEASTIPNGRIQLCSQGDYASAVDVLPRQVNDSGFSTGGMSSVIIPPGQCFESDFDTFGGANQVNVTGFGPNGTQWLVTTLWWNSETGLGIGTQGNANNTYVWTW